MNTDLFDCLPHYEGPDAAGATGCPSPPCVGNTDAVLASSHQVRGDAIDPVAAQCSSSIAGAGSVAVPLETHIDIEEGMFVGIAGLTKQPRLNGCIGLVIGFDAESRRHLVKVHNTATPSS